MTTLNYWLYVAGVNFSSTLYDTQDLSTIRGSSYGLLAMPMKLSAKLAEWVSSQPGSADYEMIFTGASEGLFKISTDIEADALKTKIRHWLVEERAEGHEPYRFLSFGIALLPCGEQAFHEVFSILKSKIRLDQLRNLTVNLAGGDSFESDQYCQVDRLRPATRRDRAGKDRMVSDSVFFRREFGKNVKQAFYERQFGEEIKLQDNVSDIEKANRETKSTLILDKLRADLGDAEEKLATLRRKGKKNNALKTPKDNVKKLKNQITNWEEKKQGNAPSKVEKYGHDNIFSFEPNTKFSNSFSDIVHGCPDGIADNLSNKVAVLYMDGNQFRKKMGILGAETPDVFQENSLSLKLYQVWLLRRIVSHFLETTGLSYKDEEMKVVRLETLFWGGDEMMLVMPSWAALDVCRIMFEEFKNWKLIDSNGNKDQLTYAAGLVIAHHKAPITQLKNLATHIADMAKELDKDQDGNRVNRNILQYEILESDDIPDTGSFDEYRKCKYHQAFRGRHFADLSFALEGDKMAKINDIIYSFKTQGMARSRLYNIINKALFPEEADQKNPTSNDYIRKELSHYKKNGNDFWQMLQDSGLGRAKYDGKFQENDGFMALVHVLQLWDYIDPQELRAEAEGQSHNKAGVWIND